MTKTNLNPKAYRNGTRYASRNKHLGRVGKMRMLKTTALAFLAAGWLSSVSGAQAQTPERVTVIQQTTAQAFEAPVRLNHRVTVSGSNILLGDVFSNVKSNADRIIANAPKPGKTLVLEARWLARVARAFDLDWQPQSHFDSVEVAREASIIGRDVLEMEIAAIASERLRNSSGTIEAIEAVLDNRLASIHLPTDAAADFAIDGLDINPHTYRFSALIVAPSTGTPTVRLPVTGSLHRVIDVPVPAIRLSRGETIEPHDIVLTRMRAKAVGPNAILDPDALIGMSAKTALLQGRPVTASTIEPPLFVKKGDMVTVSLNIRNLTLTARTRALQNGGEGDVIRVQNLESNRSFDVKIIAPSTATIDMPHLDQTSMAMGSHKLARR